MTLTKQDKHKLKMKFKKTMLKNFEEIITFYKIRGVDILNEFEKDNILKSTIEYLTIQKTDFNGFRDIIMDLMESFGKLYSHD